jgi:ankyrin repeat protein
LYTACEKGYIGIVKLLLEKGANANDNVSMKIKIIIIVHL